MATSQMKQALRQHRREHGLCIFCGAVAFTGDDGKTQTRCTACIEKDKANRKLYAARDAARGICKNTGCSNHVTGRKKYCDVCNAKSATRSSKRWYAKTNAGLCGECGTKSREGTSTRCVACNQKLRAYNQARSDQFAAAGRCRSCGKYILEANYKKCPDCIARGCARAAARKVRVINAYGGPVCVGCGETDIRILQIDHINGGGHKHAKEIGGRGKMYKWLEDNGFPEGFRVLCPSCNVRAHLKIPLPNQS